MSTAVLDIPNSPKMLLQQVSASSHAVATPLPQRHEHGETARFEFTHMNTVAWRFKRLFDIVFTVMGLVAISPLLLLVALAIKLDSPGPIFFKQRRVGLNGQHFEMFKFRSMYVDAEARLAQIRTQNESNTVMFKMVNDPRMTRVGQFIRKYSIDELPQLLNVLRGEMSLVGPRPPIIAELEAYKPWHYVRFATLPGLTGLWQTSGRASIKSFDKVVELDFRYIANWSFWLDLKLLLKTVPVVLSAKGAA